MRTYLTQKGKQIIVRNIEAISDVIVSREPSLEGHSFVIMLISGRTYTERFPTFNETVQKYNQLMIQISEET